MNVVALSGLTFIGYLLGSFPSGVLWGKLFKGIDIRTFGSGKTGATNSLRTLGWKVSLLVFVSDFSKGALAVLLPMLLSGLLFKVDNQDFTPWAVLTCGMAALVGHNHSIFIGFQGGRGFATSIGEATIISPFAVLLCIPIVFGIIYFTRYVSLASIIGCILATIFIAIQGWMGWMDWRYTICIAAAAGYVIWSHRDNIQRLRDGTERKIGEKAKPVAPEKVQQT
jgi:acyl phosphate:glycerol-3-phosphate acyltransferase